MREPDGTPRGFGFCDYRDMASAQSAVRNLNGESSRHVSQQLSDPNPNASGHSIDGRALKVNFSDPSGSGREEVMPQ